MMVWLYAPIPKSGRGGTVRIGNGSEIGERCRISIANSLEIGEKVLLSPNVYITDCDHEYRNISVPVIDQGIAQKGQTVSIGYGSYIGINAVIVGNVKIGKHCVIGANSVVTKDVPDYCVAVGSPARVIKRMWKCCCLLRGYVDKKGRENHIIHGNKPCLHLAWKIWMKDNLKL